MSYHEQAGNIKESFKMVFDGIFKDEEDEMSIGGTNLKKLLIDAILRFGQVAKYRCRSNTAYDNFSKLCFEDIVELERVKLRPEDEFEILKVKE